MMGVTGGMKIGKHTATWLGAVLVLAACVRGDASAAGPSVYLDVGPDGVSGGGKVKR